VGFKTGTETVLKPYTSSDGPPGRFAADFLYKRAGASDS
jgi:hypothetical protein